MIKVFLLIFNPGAAWEKIAQARRGIIYITFIDLIPLLLLFTAAESWGLHRHGKWQPKYEKFRDFLPPDIIAYETVQFFLLLAMVFISAVLVFKISSTFHKQQSFLPTFTTIAYGFSPMFLARALDASATMYPWTTWCIGIVLTIWILYQGIPRVMQPDPTHAFGVYFSALLVVVLTSALVRLVTGLYLLGYVDYQHSWLSRKAAHLIGQ